MEYDRVHVSYFFSSKLSEYNFHADNFPFICESNGICFAQNPKENYSHLKSKNGSADPF